MAIRGTAFSASLRHSEVYVSRCLFLYLVCGVAQLLGRHSFPGGLSCHAPDLWLIGDHIVGKLSAIGQPTQPSIPPAW